MRRLVLIAFVLAALFSGFAARNFSLQNRVPHSDEGEQAYTFLKLFSNGEYAYNPNGPHGPTLYYWADAVQKLAGTTDADSITIESLRKTLLPFFVLILCAYILSARHIGRAAAWCACACLAMSGLSCIYSVYFVQEAIFAFVIFALAMSVWNFACRPSILSAAASGLFAALSLCTKETAIISFFATAAALAGAAAIDKSLLTSFKSRMTKALALKSLAAAAAVFAVVFVSLMSSFGSNWGGVADFFASYAHFFNKAGLEGHYNPPYYYIQLLLVQKSEGVRFGELPITLLALAGLGYGLRLYFRKIDLRLSACSIYLFLNAAAAIAVLSCITYKTPWLLLSPAVFICALAGLGMANILNRQSFPAFAAAAVLIGALGYWQYSLDRNAAIRCNSDPRNPFLYSHTVRDAANLAGTIVKCSTASEYGSDIPVAFVMRESPWPLPWLLRGYRNIGYWSNSVPQGLDKFDVIVADPFTYEAVKKSIDVSKYESEFFGLRKNLVLTVYIRKNIFKKISED